LAEESAGDLEDAWAVPAHDLLERLLASLARKVRQFKI
jgi:hypothetical protein